MIPMTVGTFQLIGTVLSVVTCSAAVRTDLLTFTVALSMSRPLTVEAPERVGNVHSNRYPKEICNVYVFWYGCSVEGEDEDASVTTFTTF